MARIEIAFSQEKHNLLTKSGSIDSYSKARKHLGARHEQTVSISTDAYKFEAEMLADRVAVFFFVLGAQTLAGSSSGSTCMDAPPLTKTPICLFNVSSIPR
jgi:hypothetical protein